MGIFWMNGGMVKWILFFSEDESSLEYVDATTNKGASTANEASSIEGIEDEVIDHDKRLLK